MRSEGWLHRRGGIFTGNEVVRSCGAKGQEQIRQWATHMKHEVRRSGHLKGWKFMVECTYGGAVKGKYEYAAQAG